VSSVLPVAARDEPVQREDHHDVEDDPEDAHASFVPRTSNSNTQKSRPITGTETL
jgi:hypothetical protein